MFVGSEQIEVKLPVGSLFALEVGIAGRVGFYRFNAIFAAGFAGIGLARQDNLAVAGFEPEVEFVARFALKNLKLHPKKVFDDEYVA